VGADLRTLVRRGIELALPLLALALLALTDKSLAEAALPAHELQPVWLISTRAAPVCGPQDGIPPELGYWRYDDPSGWVCATREEFLTSGDADLPTCFFIHGNRYTHAEAIEYGWLGWRRLVEESCVRGPVRFVIWSWPSEWIFGGLEDARVKSIRSEAQSFYLAHLIDQMPPETPLSLVGYSLGARLGTGALHLLGGGRLVGNELSARLHPYRAMDNDWLTPGSRHGQALDQVDRMLILYNSRDIVLKRYRFIDPSRPSAMGYAGMAWTAAATGRVIQVDVTSWLGRAHTVENYLDTPALVHRMLPFAFPWNFQEELIFAQTEESEGLADRATVVQSNCSDHRPQRCVVKHINLDREDKRIQQFVRSLPLDPDGSILELQGEPVLRVLPVSSDAVDLVALKAAILERRRESRDLNADWESVDRETWEQSSWSTHARDNGSGEPLPQNRL